MSEPNQLTITLHPNAVVAPALRAVEQSVDMVSFSMQSLEKADLSKTPEFESSRFQMKFEGKNVSPEERKTHYTNWVLSKGFQDLARGIRAMLEEAYFYIRTADFLAQNNSNKITWGVLQEKIQEYRKQAEDAKFPELMKSVNKGLVSPLHFEKEFLSLQKVRNCLEHRDGVVGEKDIDDHTKSLKLSLPQLKLYGESDGKLTELGKGSFVEKDSKIIFKNEIQEREFKLGERVIFKPEEFHDIGFGCWVFAQDLGSKLPQVKSSGGGADTTATKVLRSDESSSTPGKSDKLKRASKLKARLPRGLTDRGPAEIAATRHMVEAIRVVFERYGFEPVETPAIEYTDALGKFLPDQDRPNEGVFSFQDDDEQWLSLRYDLTAPLARYVADKIGKEDFVLPYRSYRYGWVFRNEKPGPGRFRQFMQFDADTVGAASMAADAEMCMLAADTMEALGIPRGSYVVKVNNRLLLDQVLDGFGFTAEEDAIKRLTVLRAIDKLDRLGRDGVRHLLGSGRKDESGDFTKGAGLTADQIDFFEQSYFGFISEGRWMIPETFSESRPIADMQVGQDGKLFDNLALARGLLDSFVVDSNGYNGAGRLGEIISYCEAAGYGSQRIRIDPSVVRGLEYYTGPVYEVELLIETKDDKGRPVRFGSVGGGGRYDGLVSRFRGEPVPATGFSIGVSRLQAALTALGKLNNKPEPGPVVVTVFERDRIADYQKMVAVLRNAGIRAELYLGNPKNNLGTQLKYADKRGSPCAVIQGGDEKKLGLVQIKDLIAGAEIATTEDRADYLKKQADAQFAVKEDELVEAVRNLLARHKLG